MKPLRALILFCYACIGGLITLITISSVTEISVETGLIALTGLWILLYQYLIAIETNHGEVK